MFFFLSKTLSLLIEPVTWVLLPLGLSLLPRLHRWKKHLRVTSLTAFLLFTNPFLGNLAIRAWEYPPHPGVEQPIEYGIVLGGMANPRIDVEGQIQFNGNVERILSAIDLYRRGKISKLILSGGSGDLRKKDASESPLLRKLAISLDVKPEDILIETRSQNTHQNAQYVKDMIGVANARGALLITSSSHMRRAVGCFKKEGMDVIPYPVDYGSEPIQWHFMNFVPDTNLLLYWSELIREWVGYVVYDVVGYI